MINAICFIGGLIVGFIVASIGCHMTTQEELADVYMDGYEDGMEAARNGDSERLDI